jgi:hypothetical protein
LNIALKDYEEVLRAQNQSVPSRSLALGNYDSSSRKCGHTNAFLSSRERPMDFQLIDANKPADA